MEKIEKKVGSQFFSKNNGTLIISVKKQKDFNHIRDFCLINDIKLKTNRKNISTVTNINLILFEIILDYRWSLIKLLFISRETQGIFSILDKDTFKYLIEVYLNNRNIFKRELKDLKN